MLELFKLLEKSVEEKNQKISEMILSSENLRKKFTVGSFSVDYSYDTPSKNQRLYMVSLLNSRVEGVKLLEDSKLLEETKQELNDFLSIDKVERLLEHMRNDLHEEEYLFDECKRLLSLEEKGILFKEKYAEMKK